MICSECNQVQGNSNCRACARIWDYYGITEKEYNRKIGVKEKMSTQPWIQLINGKAFEPYNCTKDDIDIVTIAAALSKICRFGGHTLRFYSVAEHSVHVSNLLPAELKIYGLLHDAHEAYTGFGDVCNPVKTNELKLLEKHIDWQIALHFGLDVAKFYCDEVKFADLKMLNTERTLLLSVCEREWELEMPAIADNLPLDTMKCGSKLANYNFLDAFRRLTHA